MKRPQSLPSRNSQTGLGDRQVNRNLQQGMLVLEKRKAQGILGAQTRGNSPVILLF